MPVGLRGAGKRRDRARADDAVGLQAGLGLRRLDDRHQLLAVGLAVREPGQQLAILAAHLVVEIACDEMEQLCELGIGLAGLQQQLGVDDDVVLGAGVQRLELDPQRPVFGVLRDAATPANRARSPSRRSAFKRRHHVERLCRKVVIAGNAVRIDAAALRHRWT